MRDCLIINNMVMLFYHDYFYILELVPQNQERMFTNKLSTSMLGLRVYLFKTFRFFHFA